MRTYVLLGKGVDKLGEDLVGDNSLSQLIGVVGETAEGKSSGLLDGGNVIEKKRSQKGHNAYKLFKSKSVSVSTRLHKKQTTKYPMK